MYKMYAYWSDPSTQQLCCITQEDVTNYTRELENLSSPTEMHAHVSSTW